MNSPTRHADTADVRFIRVVDADARAVGTVRGEFAQWIREHLDIDAERLSDIVLAVNEALANAAEFAYMTSPKPGSVTIEAQHSLSTRTLDVVVSDEGRWYPEDPEGRGRTRGRGIPLMEALSDAVAIERSARGTSVQLLFDSCAAGVSDT